MEGENASFWLPSSFLTDDDEKTTTIHDLKKQYSSYDLFTNSRVGSDPFDSPLSSTDNDENTPEDDPLPLSNLTHLLSRTSLGSSQTNKNSTSERPWLISTSPQSTLSGYNGGWSGFSSNGSPNGPSRGPSPPLTLEMESDAAWDLLYEAAGQVARLKMNAIAAQINNNRALLAASRHHSSGFTPSVNKSGHLQELYNKQYQELKWAQNSNNPGRQQEIENSFYCRHHHHNENPQLGRSCDGGGGGLSQSAWPPLTAREPRLHRQGSFGSQMRGGVYPGGVAKRQSTGTGVFIPRKVSTSPVRQPPPHSDFRRKPTVGQHTRVAQPLDMQFEESAANLSSFSRFPTHHEVMMVRRNAILAQQRRTEKKTTASMMGQPHEILLPTDWTY